MSSKKFSGYYAIQTVVIIGLPNAVITYSDNPDVIIAARGVILDITYQGNSIIVKKGTTKSVIHNLEEMNMSTVSVSLDQQADIDAVIGNLNLENLDTITVPTSPTWDGAPMIYIPSGIQVERREALQPQS